MLLIFVEKYRMDIGNSILRHQHYILDIVISAQKMKTSDIINLSIVYFTGEQDGHKDGPDAADAQPAGAAAAEVLLQQ